MTTMPSYGSTHIDSNDPQQDHESNLNVDPNEIDERGHLLRDWNQKSINPFNFETSP
eukprot:CAMPEP_0197246218 /NCGR_PEP_ID=MMETSP1429-20130617/10742_1 /TAXON_ID=49237 /ORGANISM="Chaetoceros  sp., Strain UNC1202" /LENGTH=56 /DNA_ID=CAMNT_0042706837 /DNA_START=647 /DNA_END=813 /DNA_ORIENTATION=+